MWGKASEVSDWRCPVWGLQDAQVDGASGKLGPQECGWRLQKGGCVHGDGLHTGLHTAAAEELAADPRDSGAVVVAVDGHREASWEE